MFCCLLSSRKSVTKTQNNETKPLLTSGGTTTINYKTILTVPYAHVIRDDKIQIESSNVFISDQTYDTTCFAFDDADISAPVVLATTTTATTATGQFLFEHLFQIKHVAAVNPSSSIHMQQINRKNSMSSNTVSMARPFDEFLTDNPTTLNNPLDVQNNGPITKSDK